MIRPVQRADATSWLRLRCELWPGADAEHEANVGRFFRGELAEPAAVLLAEDAGVVVGFIELSIRAYAEGCDSENVGYVEGWFVAAASRGRAVGRALIRGAEDWARAQGCTELASDSALTDTASERAHRACGFEETGQIRCYRKIL